MKHISTQPIETPRLLLRRFTVDDAAQMFHNWACKPEVTRWMRWEPHKSVEETRAGLANWVANYQKDDYYHWAITVKESGECIGSVGVMYHEEPDEPGGWQPAYCLGPAFWGKGYTSEALGAVVPWFLQGTGCDTLYCCHAIDNPASGRVMQKAGFVFDHNGVYYKPDGTAVPAKFYILKVEAACKQTQN